MRELPIGIQNFEMLRRDNLIYVDKTKRLLELIRNGRRYFLSRPRRFGKSLTLSTLEAMFSGRAELFRGLSAEKWVKEQAQSPAPVVSIDMSGFDEPKSGQELNEALRFELEDIAYDKGLKILYSTTCGRMLKELIRELYKRHGYVVVLIDEYDNPILDKIKSLDKAEEMREVLRSFYKVLKSCDKYLKFVFITGISKFSKVGVFSAMNNLEDVSMDEQYGDIVGYTQEELEGNFGDWIEDAARRMNICRSEMLENLRSYYDGFSFDGNVKLYNPFSIMQSLKKGELGNYWYESGSPSFIVEWMREHQIEEPEEYRHKIVKTDFVGSQEIERADPSSFLFQSGYLTIERKQGNVLTLDYPNREVLDSLSSMYLSLIYRVEGYVLLGNEIWKALREGNISEMAKLYNTALFGIPYDDYLKNRNEYWYRSMFVMLLRGAGIVSYSEPHTSKGRADVVIQFKELIVVLEFKFAKSSSDVEDMKRKGLEQIYERGYSDSYDSEGRRIVLAVLVADDEERQIVIAE